MATPSAIKSGCMQTIDLEPIEQRYIIGVNSCKLFYQRYLRQDHPAKCIILLVHGFGEHVGRYIHVIESFVDAHYDVHAIDLRGHGLSGGARASGNFTEFLSDIGQLHRVAMDARIEEGPELPVFIYGQSMGGMLVLAYALRDVQHKLNGVIATSPWLRLSKNVQPPWWKIHLLRIGWPIFKEFLLSSNVDPCSLSNVDGIAHDAIHDRMVLPFITVNMAWQILAGASTTLDSAFEMQSPLLLVHGTDDTLTDPKATAEFNISASSKDKSLRLFEGAFHEIHNDIDRHEMISGIIQWINDRCDVPVSEICQTCLMPKDGHGKMSYLRAAIVALNGIAKRSHRNRWMSLWLFVFLVGAATSYRRQRRLVTSLLWPVSMLHHVTRFAYTV